MARTPSSRVRVVVGLLISIGVHAAILAMVTIDVPDAPTARLTVIHTAPIEDVEAPAPPVIQTVEIRPPGTMLPSGGGGGGAERDRRLDPIDPGGAEVVAAVPMPTPNRVASPGVSSVALAP